MSQISHVQIKLWYTGRAYFICRSTRVVLRRSAVSAVLVSNDVSTTQKKQGKPGGGRSVWRRANALVCSGRAVRSYALSTSRRALALARAPLAGCAQPAPMQGGGMPPMYGFGMMPSYGGFPQQQQGYGNGQLIHSVHGRPVGQPVMHGVVRQSSSTAATASPSKALGTASQGPGRAKTPTPLAKPVNTGDQHPSHQASAAKPGGQQAQRQGEAPASAGQRPATTSSLTTPSSSLGLQGAQPSAQGMSSHALPAHAPQRGSASALAPTQQTQATPVASHMRGGNHGGRRHWPLELWVVRHGETIENHTRTIAGQNSSGLTERGREQARLLSQRLENVKFAGIYISDLNRTKQTADAVLRTMGPGTPAFTDSRLREKAAGKYEGQKIGYIEQMTRASGQAHRVFRPPGGESWEDVALRSRSFMREVLHRYCTSADQHGRPLSHRSYDSSGRTTPVSVGYTPGSINAPGEPKRVLIVTHGGFISEFLSSAVGGVPNCAKNCSIFVLACARDHPQARAQFFLKTINEVSHVILLWFLARASFVARVGVESGSLCSI